MLHNNLPDQEPWNPCDHLSGSELGVTITRSGVAQVKRFCPDCLHPFTQVEPIKHSQVRAWGYEIDDLPVYIDYRVEGHRCEVCSSKDGIEMHHWAPRHLFTNADSWPVSFLCRGCHTYWHRTVTPDMAKRHAS